MNITITTRHMEITPAIKDYIEDRISRLDKFSPKILEAHIIITHEKYRFIAEVVLVGQQLRITAKDETNDLYGAIDMVFSKMQKRLKRCRDIIKDKHKGGRLNRRKINDSKI